MKRWIADNVGFEFARGVLLLASLLSPCATDKLRGEDIVAGQPVEQIVTLTPAQARDSFQWLVDTATRQMPRQFLGDDDWGDTKRVWAGVDVKRDGWELKTHRRFKELRHGRWVKYQLDFPGELNANPIAAEIQSVEPTEHQGWRVKATMTAPLKFDCRVERWNLGFQWYSLSAQGDARVRLEIELTFAAHADYAEVPPAIVILPNVESATLHLEHFEVDRISKLGGDAAEEIGKVIEDILRDKWLRKENAKLADRLNKAIEKKREDLRFSLASWLTKWQKAE